MGTFQVVDETEAEVDAGVGAEAFGILFHHELLVGELVVHRPVGAAGEIREVPRFGDLASAVAFGVVETQTRRELWS